MPIKKSLLIHSVILKVKSGEDRDRNATYVNYNVNYVRVVPYLSVTKGDVGATKADTMTLFIDEELSVFSDEEGLLVEAFVPEEGDVIVFEDKEYVVKSITPCYTKASRNVHHWEIGMA